MALDGGELHSLPRHVQCEPSRAPTDLWCFDNECAVRSADSRAGVLYVVVITLLLMSNITGDIITKLSRSVVDSLKR